MTLNNAREFIALFLSRLLPRMKYSDVIRCYFYRCAGMKIHGRFTSFGDIEFRPIGSVKNITCGQDCFFNYNILFAASKEKIIIGNNVRIGPGVMFLTTGHDLLCDESGSRKSTHAAINIGSRVWIGAGAIILPGVTIGDDSVVAAGAVVKNSFESGVLIAGVPAVVKRVLI